MVGIDKFKAEINAEVEKVTDAKKKLFIKTQADTIINHITEVADEEYDNMLNQSHKSFKRMWKFITDNARKFVVDNVAMIPDSVVFGWIDEYVGADDKAEVEAEEKKKAEIKAKAEETKAKSKVKKSAEPKTETLKVETPKEEPKTEEFLDEYEQLSIFDM